MNKTRLPIPIIVVSLALSAFIALQALANIGSDATSRAGMGDLQRYEAQNALMNPGSYASSRVGMGDLQRYEAQNALRNPARYAGSRVGMGDVQRYEAQNALRNPVSYASSRVGMGDLKQLEARQALAITGASRAPGAGRVCRSLSTASGERDAGASAPAYVLRVMGCAVPTDK